MAERKADILVIDDQLDNLRTLSQLLQRKGYSVRQATNGKTAIRTAIAHPPDLILLDIRMPMMDGYAVCAALKETPITSEIPIIFLSALGDISNKVRAFNSGGVDYITKPFHESEVLARVHNQLNMRQQQQQLSELLHQVQKLNTNLEQRVHAQTVELAQALEFERTLKHISDRVRDSLDKHYILQATVEELTRVLQAQCCDTVLYNPDHTTEIFCFQAEPDESSERYDTVSDLLEFPDINRQLEQGITFAFCHYSELPENRYSAILVCPVRDDRTWLGTLWLFKPLRANFGAQEVRLVQQVANQCAIALRQARLYEVAQAQIVELNQLNQLKDDFLSTISHELRTPVANMQMALQLLMLATEQGHTFLAQMAESESANNRIVRYFKILQEECEREISLIQNLLDLQQLEAGTYLLEPVTLELNPWLEHCLEPHALQMQRQQQHLILELATDLPPLTTDFGCLHRIVAELLTNACKYSPMNASITVSTEAAPAAILIHIKNSDVVIPPQEYARIFDKFYRIPSNDPWKHSGTGLGLALVRRFVKLIGASIHVSSGDRWTCFTLQLPTLTHNGMN